MELERSRADFVSLGVFFFPAHHDGRWSIKGIAILRNINLNITCVVLGSQTMPLWPFIEDYL
jgi:hypothetical protein